MRAARHPLQVIVLATALAVAVPAAGQDLNLPAPPSTGLVPRAFDTSATAVVEDMRRALQQVQTAETDYFAANQRYASSLADLNVELEGQTTVSIDSADDRGYRAVATNPGLPGAQVELVGLAPPAGMLSGRRRRAIPADSTTDSTTDSTADGPAD
jgi:hypothetical protein